MADSAPDPLRIYTALVVNVDDPMRFGRVEVILPELGGGDKPWGWVNMVRVPSMTILPKKGDMVLVQVQGELVFGLGVVNRLGGWQERDALNRVKGVLNYNNIESPAEFGSHPTSKYKGKTLLQWADEAAEEHSLPRYLFRGMISRESKWYPRSYNPNSSKQQYTDWVATHPNHPGKKGAWEVRPGKPIREHTYYGDEKRWGAYGLGNVMLITALGSGLGFHEKPGDIYHRRRGGVLFQPDRALDIAARVLGRFYRMAGKDWDWSLAMYHSGKSHYDEVRKKRIKHTIDPKTWPEKTRTIYVPTTRKFIDGWREADDDSQDMPKLARGDYDLTGSPMLRGKAREILKSLREGSLELYGGGEVVQPTSPANSEYGHNKVTQDEAGNTIEMDATPGNERMNLRHRTGTGIEFGAQGQRSSNAASAVDVVEGKASKILGVEQKVVRGGSVTQVRGRKVDMSGDRVTETDGSHIDIVQGPRTTVVKGSNEEETKGKRVIKATGGPLMLVGPEIAIGAVRKIVLSSRAGPIHLTANTEFVGAAGGAMSLLSGEDVQIGRGFGSVSLPGKQRIVLEPMMFSLDVAMTALRLLVEAMGGVAVDQTQTSVAKVLVLQLAAVKTAFNAWDSAKVGVGLPLTLTETVTAD